MEDHAATLVYQIPIAVLLGLVLLLVLAKRHPKRPLAPSPPAHFLWGHVPAIMENGKRGIAPTVLWKQWTDKWGPIMSLNFVALRATLVTDPAAAREVVAVRNYHKSRTYQNLALFLGKQSMVLIEDEQWAHVRKAFSPAFTLGALKQMVPMFQQQALILASLLEQVATGPGEDGAGKPAVSMMHHLMMLTMDVIHQAALGINTNFQTTKPVPKLFTAYVDMLNAISKNMDNPMFRHTAYLPWVSSRLHRMRKQLLSELQPAIDACKAAAAAGPGGSASSSSHVANAIITQALRTAAANGHPLDEATCVSQVVTMNFAGHDTTASTMSWVIYELTRHPEVEQKLVAELRQALGDKWDSRDPRDVPSADELVHMQYLNAVIKETMRLWPIGGTARWGPPGAVLHGFDVSHQMLYVDPYILHRNEGIWGPDAQDFRPERWLGDNPVTDSIHPYAYQPFSKGPRDCLGQNLALLEMRAVLTELYRRFTFTYAGAQPETILYQVTNKPKFGVMVRVHKRMS